MSKKADGQSTAPLPLLLSLECSTLSAGVALYRGTEALAQQTWTRQTTHGEHLTPSVEMIFRITHLKISDVDAIAVGNGPGSFTGVRIAVNTAKSLAYALKKPVLAFSSLHILAENEVQERRHDEKTQFIAVMDALNGLFFSARYRYQDYYVVEHSPPQLSSREDIETEITRLKKVSPVVVCGDFPSGNMDSAPKVQSLAILGHAYFLNHSTLNWNEVAPLYIRASSAEEKFRKLNERAKTSKP